MLILTRRPGESIKIGDDITLVVKEVNGREVRLAFEAPPHVKVWRQEIYVRIQKERGQVDQEIGQHMRKLAGR